MTEYTIRHRTLGDVGGFDSMTAATMIAIAIGWPLDEWTIELVEVLS
jgi:hypothetical protein